MDIEDLIDYLNIIAPPELSEDFDEGRIGLIVEGRKNIEKIACALDATEYTVSEAVKAKADILIVHHTPIWNPVTKISGNLKSILKTSLKADLNIFVMHTNFDHADEGINHALAEILNLENREKLSLGILGRCCLNVDELSKILGGNIRIYKNPGKIEKLAVAGGSGFDTELIKEAELKGADAYLSSELKHSVLLSAGIPLIESTHYALESPGMKALAKREGWIFIEEKPHLKTVL
ncbi:Nif3-like dinuclear metal center hexameric protein [Methanomicrobium antiquum]|uniref:Nif3-like dinuclear metal center hexameric protein n=1 Tax=Methanomicrobium antiquum TaxID=487686 RepID=A0AAF0JMF5_9EURY|nr:Nif3-like dinuclear metal center hexameric protein [Methanomicrobium antiquum]MDD3976981.1 Nif3-like dinuclear metal center hexameric protein [Methanomicrobium sp.]WFN37809.1 Nif3-like dinuclear metal center hexameric protein [Methanomicrobium antiquum]